MARGITLPVKDTPSVDVDSLERWSEDEWNRSLDGTSGDLHQVAWMLLTQGVSPRGGPGVEVGCRRLR